MHEFLLKEIPKKFCSIRLLAQMLSFKHVIVEFAYVFQKIEISKTQIWSIGNVRGRLNPKEHEQFGENIVEQFETFYAFFHFEIEDYAQESKKKRRVSHLCQTCWKSKVSYEIKRMLR